MFQQDDGEEDGGEEDEEEVFFNSLDNIPFSLIYLIAVSYSCTHYKEGSL
jgi:hypothetical protein